MKINGIGPLVSELVHDRNAARHVERSNGSEHGIEVHSRSRSDGYEFGESALARFENVLERLAPEIT